MIDDDILRRAEDVLQECRRAGITLATAESCTGGLVVAALTAVAGSSDVVDRGFVTYSNAAKTQLLGVADPLIASRGAVSEEVARAMAEGALARAGVGIAVSVTGIAGPGGGSPEKPVGLVCFGLARTGHATHTARHVFAGDRAAVRHASVVTALDLLHQGAGLKASGGAG